MLTTMEVIQYFAGLRKATPHDIPQPIGTVTQQRDAYLLLRNTFGNRLKIQRKCFRVLDLMPTGKLDNPILCANQIDPHSFGFMVDSRTAFFVAFSRLEYRSMRTITRDHQYRPSFGTAANVHDPLRDLLFCRDDRVQTGLLPNRGQRFVSEVISDPDTGQTPEG